MFVKVARPELSATVVLLRDGIVAVAPGRGLLSWLLFIDSLITCCAKLPLVANSTTHKNNICFIMLLKKNRRKKSSIEKGELYQSGRLKMGSGVRRSCIWNYSWMVNWHFFLHHGYFSYIDHLCKAVTRCASNKRRTVAFRLMIIVVCRAWGNFINAATIPVKTRKESCCCSDQ